MYLLKRDDPEFACFLATVRKSQAEKTLIRFRFHVYGQFLIFVGTGHPQTPIKNPCWHSQNRGFEKISLKTLTCFQKNYFFLPPAGALGFEVGAGLPAGF